MFEFSAAEWAALWQVLVIDIVLSGDNAIVVGLAAASVAPELRERVIAIGIAIAVIMRVAFALLTVQLLDVPGVKLIGGALLLWVCWRFLTDLLSPPHSHEQISGTAEGDNRMWRAVSQIAVADLSMSLDNVLAVASASSGYEWILIVGLALSILLMALAATLIARLLDRHRWIGWLGLAVIFYVAVKMIWEGLEDLHWVSASTI